MLGFVLHSIPHDIVACSDLYFTLCSLLVYVLVGRSEANLDDIGQALRVLGAPKPSDLGAFLDSEKVSCLAS